MAAWGNVERRFRTHSIRKSFLSALYGVFQDRIDLDRTLAELGIDDVPALTPEERSATVADLIRSRSGVYHDAAAESADMLSDRPDRGSHAPGTHWWYNNWDFNAAGVAFERLTGEAIFDAFATRIATPIGMQDFRVWDGFDHFERDRSLHPAYSFRMSTRDLARFGLLFARGGRWNDEQIIPAAWVDESTRSHSDTGMSAANGDGYGYMWWIEGARGFTARGWGGHILAVYPDEDLVMVIRADTWRDRYVSSRAAMRLFDRVASARAGEPAPAPRLVPLRAVAREPEAVLTPDELARLAHHATLESGREVVVTVVDEALHIDYGLGPERLVAESAVRFHGEDSYDPVHFELAEDGTVAGVTTEQLAYLEAGAAASRGDVAGAVARVRDAVAKFPDSPTAHASLALALSRTGRPAEALAHAQRALALDPHDRSAARLLTRLRLRRYVWLVALAVIALLALFGRRRAARRRRLTGARR